MPHPVLLRCALFLSITGLGCWPAVAERFDASQAKPSDDGKLLWHDIRALDVEGQGWTETKAPFDRLPKKAKDKVRGDDSRITSADETGLVSRPMRNRVGSNGGFRVPERPATRLCSRFSREIRKAGRKEGRREETIGNVGTQGTS